MLKISCEKSVLFEMTRTQDHIFMGHIRFPLHLDFTENFRKCAMYEIQKGISMGEFIAVMRMSLL